MKKILIVEDDVNTLDWIGFLVEDIGYEVLKSLSRPSLSSIIEQQPALVLVDYWLSDSYGSDICLELKSNPATKNIPVVLMSVAFQLPQIASECHADGYILKPFNLRDLENMVKDILEKQ